MGCWKIGVPSSCLFVSSDLYKARGMNEVLNNLESLSKMAARMKDYTGPVLAIHERERPGASPATKAAPRRATKKWDTVEMNKPRHINETVSHEDVDIRSENLRLKQQLEREKYDRLSIEEELEALKKSKGGAAVSSTSKPNDKLEREWKNKLEKSDKKIADLENKIAQLEKKIGQLENDLSTERNKKSTATSTNISSTSKDSKYEVETLKRQLEDEKRAHQSTNQKLSREKDSAQNLEKEIRTLNTKILNLSSGEKTVTRSNSTADVMVANLKEENQMLRELIAQLRTDLDLAVQLQKTEKNHQGKKHGPNYFIIDEMDESASAGIQRVEDCLRDILSSEDVEFSDVVELNQFFKVDSGRRKFTQMLESLMQETSSLDLSDNSFELMLYLINTTLTEMDTSDSNDLITAKILMRASSVLIRKTDGKPVQDFIANYSVFHDISFWEELFWDELFRTHKHRSGMEEDDVYTLDHDLTLKVITSLITVMLHWNSFRDEIVRFVDSILQQTKTPEEFSQKLTKKMAADSFWESAANAKMKDGVWKPKKVKGGSRLRRKKKGSRIAEKKGSRLADKKEKETPPVKSEPRANPSPRKVAPAAERATSPIKDRISKWEQN